MASIPNSNLVDVLESKAKRDPGRPFVKILETSWRTDGARTLTFAQAVRAADRLAWWLDENLGKSTGNFEAFTYLGLSDVRYAFVIFAAIKTQRRVSVRFRQR